MVRVWPIIGNLDRLIERYRAAGLRPALVRYPQGRHEILNETNRTEVVQNLLNSLNQVIDHDGKDPLRASNRVEN